MTFGIKLAGASFTNYLARSIPYLEDTEAVFIFGSSEAQSIRNLSPNVPAATVGAMVGGGSGSFTDDYALLNIDYSLDSGVSYAGINKTMISVSAFMADEHSSIVAPQIEVSCVDDDYRVRITTSGYLYGASNPISLNVPYFQGVTSADGSGNDTAYLGRGGTLQTATAADAPVTDGAIVFGPRGGRDSISDMTGHKHYIALVYDRELSGAEMAEVYAWCAEYLSARGVLLG